LGQLKPADLVLFAWPDEKAEENRFEIAIPNLAASSSPMTSTACSKASRISNPGARRSCRCSSFRIVVGTAWR
jgi:cytochrome d ubiquinol oxidase subunit I